MNVSSGSNYLKLTEGNYDFYYRKGDLLIKRMDQSADPSLYFIQANTGAVLHRTAYSAITGIVSADVDDFIDQWQALNAVASGGVKIGDPVSGGTVNRILFVDGSGNVAGHANLQTIGGRLIVSIANINFINNGDNSQTVMRTTNGSTTASFDGQITLLGAGKGIQFKSPDGLTTKILTIDNTGTPVWT